jgi:hypothetical protein
LTFSPLHLASRNEAFELAEDAAVARPIGDEAINVG